MTRQGGTRTRTLTAVFGSAQLAAMSATVAKATILNAPSRFDWISPLARLGVLYSARSVAKEFALLAYHRTALLCYGPLAPAPTSSSSGAHRCGRSPGALSSWRSRVLRLRSTCAMSFSKACSLKVTQHSRKERTSRAVSILQVYPQALVPQLLLEVVGAPQSGLISTASTSGVGFPSVFPPVVSLVSVHP